MVYSPALEIAKYEKRYGKIDTLSRLAWSIIRIGKEKKLLKNEILDLLHHLNPYKPQKDTQDINNIIGHNISNTQFADVFKIVGKWGILNKNKETIKQTFIQFSTKVEIKEKEQQGLVAKWGASLSPSDTQRSLHRRFIGLAIGDPILGGKIPGEDFNCKCTLYFI